jgi:hypothetical protein
MGISRAISFASELSPGSHFHLLADVGEPDDPVCIHPTTLAISRFSCRITSDFYARLCSRRLGGIFASLSLPNLEELRLISTEDPKIVYDWPHAQFLELSERSGFHRSLKVLRIPEVLITDGDLIAVLSSLESLEHLEVADKQRVDGEGVDLVVVTDIFLQAITFQAPDANRHLIPRLRRFTCATQLQFTDHVFVAFVASRLKVCSSCTFRVDIRFLDGLEGASHRASLSTLLHDLRVHGGSRLEYDLGDGHLPLA